MPAARSIKAAMLHELARALNAATNALRAAAASENGDARQHALERGMQAVSTLRTLLSLPEEPDMITFGTLQPSPEPAGPQFTVLADSTRQVLRALEATAARVPHQELAAQTALPREDLRTAVVDLYRRGLVTI